MKYNYYLKNAIDIYYKEDNGPEKNKNINLEDLYNYINSEFFENASRQEDSGEFLNKFLENLKDEIKDERNRFSMKYFVPSGINF